MRNSNVSLVLKPNPTKLHIYHESRKRRTFVGELIYNTEKDKYILIYDKQYAKSKNAIPIGPELELIKLRHQSEKGKLFPSFIDRIPDKNNPAYKDYCETEGISPTEDNPIILLGTIGKRGPSSIIFEPVYSDEFKSEDIIKFREVLQLTQYDLAEAFDIQEQTLRRIEAEESQDPNTLRYLKIIFNFPEVALWQLKQTGGRIHESVLNRLIQYFESRM